MSKVTIRFNPNLRPEERNPVPIVDGSLRRGLTDSFFRMYISASFVTWTSPHYNGNGAVGRFTGVQYTAARIKRHVVCVRDRRPSGEEAYSNMISYQILIEG